MRTQSKGMMDQDELDRMLRKANQTLAWVNQDHLPRIFQANIRRFYDWVIVATLERFQPHENVKVGGAASDEEFFDNLEKSIFNQVAQEARRAFAITLGTTFERQFRRWFSQFLTDTERPQMWQEPFLTVFPRACNVRGLDIEASEVGALIRELTLLVNVLRHGEGRSVKALFEAAPHLWDHLTPYDVETSWRYDLMSEGIRLLDVHLARYAWAGEAFWEMADMVQGAVRPGRLPPLPASTPTLPGGDAERHGTRLGLQDDGPLA